MLVSCWVECTAG